MNCRTAYWSCGAESASRASVGFRPAIDDGHAQLSCPTHHSLHLLRRANNAAYTAFRHIARAHDRLPRSPYGLGVCGQAALQPFIYEGFREGCPQSLY